MTIYFAPKRDISGTYHRRWRGHGALVRTRPLLTHSWRTHLPDFHLTPVLSIMERAQNVFSSEGLGLRRISSSTSRAWVCQCPRYWSIPTFLRPLQQSTNASEARKVLSLSAGGLRLSWQRDAKKRRYLHVLVHNTLLEDVFSRLLA